MEIELRLLVRLLAWLLTGGGIGVCGWWLVSVIETHWLWFAGLRYDHKRYFSFVIVGLFAAPLAIGLIYLAGWLGALAMPATPQLWVSTVFEITAVAILSSQGAHGAQEAKAGAQ